MRLRPHIRAGVPGLIVVSLMVLWAEHDGGYDSDTWYWGALIVLALFAWVLITFGVRSLSLTRASAAALSFFALYVAWSYASIAWAQYPGAALQGSNRALLYLLVFSLFLALPWTTEAALVALLTFVIGVGVIAIVVLVRLASGDQVSALFIQGRLAAPTGYINSTAALFTIDALAAIALAARRELPGLLRGLLLGLASASLQLAVIVQSRGWLFTLPIVAVVTVLIVRDRLRFAMAAVIPAAATLAVVRRLLHVYQSSRGASLEHAAILAGHAALLASAAAFLVATLIAWGEQLRGRPPLGSSRRHLLGALVATLAVAASGAGSLAVSHGHPFRFISREWRGFSHEDSGSSGSHFAAVGTVRYDFWRVALDAVIAHPIGGLGQDNFADYYIKRRRTSLEPQWTHSLELRLLAHTGLVGFGLYMAFLVSAIAAALGARRRSPGMAGQLAGVAVIPFVVWLVHGSIDWFWEMPALSAPALGFLGMAAALGRPAAARRSETEDGRAAVRARIVPKPVALAAGTMALLASVIALGLPYLSVREVSVGNHVGIQNPTVALKHLKLASKLNPLSADPGRFAGAIALQTGEFQTAEQRFRESISRDPGGWFSWLGAGLAASALGDTTSASKDFKKAQSIDSVEPAINAAVARVRTRHPLTTDEAFRKLIVVG